MTVLAQENGKTFPDELAVQPDIATQITQCIGYFTPVKDGVFTPPENRELLVRMAQTLREYLKVPFVSEELKMGSIAALVELAEKRNARDTATVGV